MAPSMEPSPELGPGAGLCRRCTRASTPLGSSKFSAARRHIGLAAPWPWPPATGSCRWCGAIWWPIRRSLRAPGMTLPACMRGSERALWSFSVSLGAFWRRWMRPGSRCWSTRDRRGHAGVRRPKGAGVSGPGSAGSSRGLCPGTRVLVELGYGQMQRRREGGTAANSVAVGVRRFSGRRSGRHWSSFIGLSRPPTSRIPLDRVAVPASGTSATGRDRAHAPCLEDLLILLALNGTKDGWPRLETVVLIAEIIRPKPQLRWPEVLAVCSAGARTDVDRQPVAGPKPVPGAAASRRRGGVDSDRRAGGLANQARRACSGSPGTDGVSRTHAVHPSFP